MRCALIAVGLALAVSAPTTAQERKDPVEAALRRRVESWLRDRSPGRLQCPACKDGPQVRACDACKGSRMNPHRVGNAIWNYTPPSFRSGKKKDDWLRESGVVARNGGRWGDHTLMVEAQIQAVLLTRDVAWVTVADANGRRPVTDAWIKEGRDYYLDMAQAPGEQLVTDDWFVLGTFSVNALSREVERILGPEDNRELTDLERARLLDERKKAEEQLGERVVADVATVENVRRARAADDYGRRREGPAVYEVVAVCGFTRLRIEVTAGEGEKPEQLEERLGAFSRGAKVIFRAKPRSWTRSTRSLALEEIVLGEGELRAAE